MNEDSSPPAFVVRPLPEPHAQISAVSPVRLKPGATFKRIVRPPRPQAVVMPRRRVPVRRNALPSGLAPRLLNRDAAAAYCGISTAQFVAHVSPHVPPILIGQKRLWDMSAIDRWLDQGSGVGDAALSPEQWLERLDGDPGARR